MSVAIILIFVAIAIGVSIYRERKAVPATESIRAKLSSALQGLFVHPGHSWVRVTEPSLVTVGADEFTKSVFGSVEAITLPEVGSLIQQGGKAWGLKRGRRQLNHFLVTIVPKSDDVEVAELGRQVCNTGRAYTDVVRAVARTAMFFVFFDQVEQFL